MKTIALVSFGFPLFYKSTFEKSRVPVMLAWWNYISPFKGSTVREQSTVARCDDVSSVNYPGDGDRNRKKSLVFFLCSPYVSLTVCYYYKICRHTLVRYKHESLPAKPTDRYNTILSLASLVLWFFFFSLSPRVPKQWFIFIVILENTDS